MYGQNTKKRNQPHYARQFEVYNITSGTVVTFEDDGVAADTGEPNQARRHALMKLDALDGNGDPLFVPKRPLPAHVQQNDRIGSRKIAVFRELDDPCKDPDFNRLRDKWEENARLRSEFPQRFKKENRTEPMPIVAERAAGQAVKLEAAKDDAAAAGAVKAAPKKRGRPKSAPAGEVDS